MLVSRPVADGSISEIFLVRQLCKDRALEVVAGVKVSYVRFLRRHCALAVAVKNNAAAAIAVSVAPACACRPAGQRRRRSPDHSRGAARSASTPACRALLRRGSAARRGRAPPCWRLRRWTRIGSIKARSRPLEFLHSTPCPQEREKQSKTGPKKLAKKCKKGANPIGQTDHAPS